MVARKPLIGTVAGNVLAHGTGALNIDGCRIDIGDGESLDGGRISSSTEGWDRPYKRDADTREEFIARGAEKVAHAESLGRWPANVILDEEAGAMLDEQAPKTGGGGFPSSLGGVGHGLVYGAPSADYEGRGTGRVDANGGASRFFYCAKTGRAERHAGLGETLTEARIFPSGNLHPTVKPIDLMRWLVRLVTPRGGVVLDPFLGSGTTGCAAALEGFSFVGVEREAEYMAIAEARIAFWTEHGEDGIRICAERDAAGRERRAITDAGQLDLFALDG